MTGKLWLCIFLLGGCYVSTDKGSSSGPLSTNRGTASTSTNGTVDLTVNLKSNQTSFLVTAVAASGVMALESITDPYGNKVFDWQDWSDGTYSLTNAIWPEAADVVVNWPVRADDGPLASGTWTVTLSTLTLRSGQYYYAPNIGFDYVKQRKRDSDLSSGTVKALVVYASGLAGDPTVVDATESAVQRWGEIWGAYGIDLQVDYADSDIDPKLPNPTSGSSDFKQAAQLGSNDDITVIIGESISGDPTYYGMTGTIPDALVSTNRSVVAISWLANAGGDGSFNNTDLEIYGETLAHEAGHYLGLFHPVEATYDAWDALDDTEQCRTQTQCENDLGSNLMYPTPVCNWTSCVQQVDLTDDQVGVIQRYTGTL